MKLRKIITIIGARPQFVKASVLSALFQKSRELEEIIIHTGQHYDKAMSELFFDQLGIPRPKYNLGIGGGSHGENTGRMIEAIEKILLSEKPDAVLVYGDTDSTLAGTIAASKLYIPICHVEAGLRSFNNRMPEEINRVLTDRVSSLLFAPTVLAEKNLLSEGLPRPAIKLVGDVMFDAVLNYSVIAAEKSKILETVQVNPDEYILCTIHRPVNTDSVTNLAAIFDALKTTQTIVFPVHPRTKKIIEQNAIAVSDNIRLIDPVGYLDMLNLEKNAQLIITDSGGVQKEAFFQKKYCITLREETEWQELVEIGVNTLIGFEYHKLKNIFENGLPQFAYESKNAFLYGDGNAGAKIIDAIVDFLNKQ
ncbi:MAG: UDP-N-acetylglucosamine 2-epimerase (non-hydrolyzing) [Chitinophagaceae bacterium]|nr:UDP-N-acetylglucosamine 2-epimerase (non-hydrolyzing) [Chitinophagaceae bacterium]